MVYQIKIVWDGPFSVKKIIDTLDNGRTSPDFEGEDYGVYQIYGKHILSGPNTLLYIGETTNQTFSGRFKQHEEWLDREENVRIYVGRVYDPKKHSKKDNWASWIQDIETAEKILIYKYSPNYNTKNIYEKPLLPQKNIRLIHTGHKSRLHPKDNAPEDYT
ncbi:MAG: hypothetical protein ABSH06_31075 [Thermodesulfobacteriota bacterium]|jgi:hypothetical protein